jgi:hypothetical protein
MRVSWSKMTAAFVLTAGLAYAGCGSSDPLGFSGDDGGGGGGDEGGLASDDGGGVTGFGSGGGGGDAAMAAAVEGGLFNEGGPLVDGSACVADAGGAPPITRVCLAATNNECDGAHDFPGFPANGAGGNGFDDDCDGLVDEGCACTSPGSTKDCYLVPASQTAGGLPVGFCAANSKGTVDCQKVNEVSSVWSGQCRGAQPPYADDVCAPGDFNCDGLPFNSKAQNCTCQTDPVVCPSTPLTTAPYPPVAALPLKVDAASWFAVSSSVASATNWKWTMQGGDCDNILPHPTFSLYPTSNASGAGVGTQNNTLGLSAKEHGVVATAPAVSSAVYPAFSVSGDYLLTGEFDFGGKHYACQQKIQVRAPGIRAEACWDTEAAGDDLDLHLARVDGYGGCSKKGWSNSCAGEDCYWSNCVNASPAWYAASAATACHGWGSQTTGTCNNPRLDRDANGVSGTCNSSVTNPNQFSSGPLGLGGGYCGPENINVDAPANGSSYAVGVKFYGGSDASKTHVNIYCNGARIFSAGYNPITGSNFPVLAASGQDTSGDMWKVALVSATVAGGTLSCAVNAAPSAKAHAATDGTTANCVDNTSTDGANADTYLTSSGGTPATAAAMCFH